MLKILALVLCGVFVAHGRPEAGSFQRLQQMNGPSPHVIGGTPAATGEFPYAVSIQYDSATTGWGHFCGGVLYRDRYVISTAHCIDNKQTTNMRVVAGVVNLQDTVNSQIISISSYITHPGYSVVTGLPNDIAVITLTNPITTGGSAQNAPLPADDGNLYIQDDCSLVGWGQTEPSNNVLPDILHKLTTPVINNANCSDEMGGLDNAAIFDTHICTQATNLDTGSCDADTGSPLTCCRSETDCTQKFVVGITSYFITISGACSTRYPSVHVRTSKFKTWIDANTP